MSLGQMFIDQKTPNFELKLEDVFSDLNENKN
jgi:hypothetical protein